MNTHHENTKDNSASASDAAASPYGQQSSPYGVDRAGNTAGSVAKAKKNSDSWSLDSLGSLDSSGIMKDMWDTRPVRIPSDQGSDAKIAGVCEGIGARYQIDPTLVRVGFVVGTIAGGAGIPAYLAMWGLMPKYSKTTAPFEEAFGGKEDTGESGTGWTLAIIGGLMLLTGTAVSSGTLLITAAVLTGALYLLHKRKPLPPAGLLAEPKAVSNDIVDMSMFEPVEGYDAPPGRTAPPAWDPLGAAPDLWNLNEPAPVAPSKDIKTRKKNRRALTASVATAGVLTVAGVGAAALFGIGGFGSDGDASDNNGSIGSKDVVPASVDALGNDIETGIGSHDIDLTKIEDFDSLNSSTSMDVETGIGSIDIKVPADAPVVFNCSTGLGSENCDDANTYTGDGHVITMDVSTGLGSIDVERVAS